MKTQASARGKMVRRRQEQRGGKEGRSSERAKAEAGARAREGVARAICAAAAAAAAAHSIRMEAARNQSSLPNGVSLVSSSLVASVDLVGEIISMFSTLSPH